MDSAVVAAVIAASVSLLTLIVSVVAQIYGIRKTSSGTAETLKQLDRTLAEQRARTLNERFATAAEQLGSDKPPAVRLTGVYAMAGLADDWPEHRQTCVDVLCAYLRLPYDPDPGDEADPAERAAYRANREVRYTVIRLIGAHLRDGVAVSWQGLNFDFTGVVFDGGSFSSARFSGGEVSFRQAEFSGGDVSFRQAEISGGTVSFYAARFCGGTVDFSGARFSGGEVSFRRGVFSSGTVEFEAARFCGGIVTFRHGVFSDSRVDFSRVSDWSVPPVFDWTDTPPLGVKLPQKEDQSQA
jgi:Pentapeptide repeats (9 copies)